MRRKNESVAEELDLEELIFDLHESDIHVALQTSNVGMMLTITDGLSRIQRGTPNRTTHSKLISRRRRTMVA